MGKTKGGDDLIVKKLSELIRGTEAQNLIADRGYDTSQIIEYALDQDMNVVIPSEKNRKVEREYDKQLSKGLSVNNLYNSLTYYLSCK